MSLQSTFAKKRKRRPVIVHNEKGSARNGARSKIAKRKRPNVFEARH
jgi:hypothetical protein